MKKEKSCGAVLFTQGENGRRYLVIQSINGHYTMCKGHVEGSETEHETAIREIREETGLEVEFVENFRHVITYSPYVGCTKDVVFFLARVTGGVLTCQPEEVKQANFLPVDAALAALTHPSDRDVLAAAEHTLANR